MLPDIERLIALQRLDSTAHEANRKIAEEPAREAAFDARLDSVRQKVAAAKELLAENQNTRRTLEKEAAVQQGRLSKFREQLMAVKTNVEYQAVQKEIEFAQTELKGLEDRILERMMEADDESASVKRAESELATEQKAIGEERAVVAKEMGEQKAALTRVATARGELIAQLDPKVIALFELVAKRRNGIAVSEARDGVCTICHVRLRPQVFNTIRRNEEIIQCDHCNRILYFVPGPAASAAAEPAPQPAP